ncbi:MAG: hypothetical protein K2K34_00130, partial [Oscillospiraceae bacterium]|nr:hypothetical protein [Oscillospiraceae bacterium]
TDTAAKTVAQADLTSILDVAQSTGDFQTAAYYYCVKMAACIVAKDGSGAAEAYDQGIYYLDAFSDSDMVMAVLALYQTEGGLGNSAIETAKKIKWRSLPRPMRKCGRSFSELIKARNLLDLERYEEAGTAARASMESSCTEFMSSRAEEILKLADEKKLEADIAKEKEASEAENEATTEEASAAEETPETEESPVLEKTAESSEAKTDEAEDTHDF